MNEHLHVERPAPGTRIPLGADVQFDDRSGTLTVRGASGKTYRIGVAQGRDEEGRLDPISHHPVVWDVYETGRAQLP